MNYKLLPIYIQKNMGQSGDTPPVPDQPVVDISEGPHFGYALQWFTFALILLLGYPYFIKRQEKLAIKGREI
jgi:surfeit locus 1 family protein